MTDQIFGFGGEVDVSLPRKWKSRRLSTGEAVVGILERKGKEEIRALSQSSQHLEVEWGPHLGLSWAVASVSYCQASLPAPGYEG